MFHRKTCEDNFSQRVRQTGKMKIKPWYIHRGNGSMSGIDYNDLAIFLDIPQLNMKTNRKNNY